MMSRRFAASAVALAVCSALGSTLHAAPPAGLKQKVDAWVTANQRAIVTSSSSCWPSRTSPPIARTSGRTPTRLREMLARRGLTAEILETAGNPLVWGELKVAGATRTILFYAHYDGQPVNPKDWKQPSPFTPILRAGRMEDNAAELADLATRTTFGADQRIYARSASDDKSPIVALLAALDALKANGLQPSSNIRVDSGWRGGSQVAEPGAGDREVSRQADRGRMFILDGPLHPSERPTIVYGARGILTLQLTVVRAEGPAAQRSLRELGAESGDAPRPAARHDEGRRWQGAHQGVL